MSRRKSYSYKFVELLSKDAELNPDELIPFTQQELDRVKRLLKGLI